MKKTVALLLALVLLLAVPACAEDLYLRELPQYTYVNEKLLTWESYPEVRIAPYSAYNLFSSYNPVEPMFLCFPGPDGALANEFDVDFVTYLDESNAIQYNYQMRASDSFEEFVNKAAADEYILLDGSDGVAIYLDPDRNSAYGMLAAKEFDKSAKLVIRITLDALSSKMPLDTRVQALVEAIVPEVARVSKQMRYEVMDPFWSYNQFVGVELLDEDDFDTMLMVDFPPMTLDYGDGSQQTESMIVTKMRFGELTGYYNFGEGVYLQVDIAKDDAPFALYKLEEEKSEDAQVVTLANGSTWYIFMSGLTENGEASSCYAATPLGYANRYDKENYLTIHFSGNNLCWGSVDDLLEDLALFDASYALLSAGDDPYVPSEKPAATSAPVAPGPANKDKEPETPDDATWTCPECGTESEGNFCPECGTAKPVSAEWTCPSCGSVNEGNFCPECGTARPGR